MAQAVFLGIFCGQAITRVYRLGIGGEDAGVTCHARLSPCSGSHVDFSRSCVATRD